MARIIIVAKSKIVQQFLRQVFEEEFHDDVRVFDNGLKAISYHQVEPVDLVVVDMVEPDQAGTDAIMDLRRDCPDLKILALADDNGATARGLGADDVFERGCNRNDLRMKLKGLLSEAYLP